MSDMESYLEELGLDKSQSKIFLFLNKNGPCTVTQISKNTGIHRSYVYDLVSKLEEKGMICKYPEGAVSKFKIIEPKKIKQNYFNRLQAFDKIIEQLDKENRSNLGELKIDIFRGKVGIRTIFNDILKTGKDYFGIGFGEEFEKYFENESLLFINQLKKTNIKEHGIISRNSKITPAKKHEYRYLPKNSFMTTSFLVYGDKVVLFIWKFPFIQILIEDEDIANSYKKQFALIWKSSDKLSK